MALPSIFPNLSRMGLAQNAAAGGISLFTDDSELGSWMFAPGLGGSKDYKETVPIKALDQGEPANRPGHRDDDGAPRRPADPAAASTRPSMRRTNTC